MSCVTCARAGSHKGSHAVYPLPHSKDGRQEPPVTKPPTSFAVFTPPCLPLTQSKPNKKTPKLLPHLCCCSTSSRRLLPSLLLPLLLYMQVLGWACWKGLMALLAAREEEDWHTCRAKPLILFKPRNPLARAFFRSCCLKAFKPVGHEEKKCTLILLSVCLQHRSAFLGTAFLGVGTGLEETPHSPSAWWPEQDLGNGTGAGTAAPLCRWTCVAKGKPERNHDVVHSIF